MSAEKWALGGMGWDGMEMAMGGMGMGMPGPWRGASWGLPRPGGCWGAALTMSPPRSICAGGSWRCAEAPCPVAALCPGGLVHAPGSCLRRCDGAEPNGTCAGIADGCVCPPGTVFLVCDPLPGGGSPRGLGELGHQGAGEVGGSGDLGMGDQGLGGPGDVGHRGCGVWGADEGYWGVPAPLLVPVQSPPCCRGAVSPLSPPHWMGGVSHRQDGRCVSPEECPCHHGGRLYWPNDTIVWDCNTW